jgi:hypothetical protein
MSCTPISVSLEVDPTELRKIIFGLDRICHNDGTSEWKIHFELQERNTAVEPFRNVIKLDVDVNHEDDTLAAATARHGLDENQRGQAAIAAATAKAVTEGNADPEDAQADVAAILPARSVTSPRAEAAARV